MTASSVKQAVKVFVAYGLYYTGILPLWKAIVLRRRAVVLMYHRVLTDDEQRRSGSHPGIVVARGTFARHLDVLARGFRVLSLAEFAERLERREPFEPSSCLITFDDGWSDNFTHALPALVRRRLPAVVFLPVNFIGSRRLFWREALTHLAVEAVDVARRTPDRGARLAGVLRPLGLDGALTAPGDARTAVCAAVSALSRADRVPAESAVAALSSELGIRIEERPTPDTFMCWSQVEDMARQGVAFGGHGAEHLVLTDVPAEVVRDEVVRSKQALDERLQGTVPTFSYPNGNWTPEIAGEVRRAGYRLAFTTEPGVVACDDDPFSLRRVNIHEAATSSTPMFLARVVGLF